MSQPLCTECREVLTNDGRRVQLCPTHAQAPAMAALLKHVPHNRTPNLHVLIEAVAGCPGCDASALLKEIDG